MGPKDETSAKAAEIGDGLIESLGFEPAGAKAAKATKGAAAGVSGQLSEAGFSVTDALDASGSGSSAVAVDTVDAVDGVDGVDGAESSESSASVGESAESTNGSAAGNGSSSGSKSGADFVSENIDAEAKSDGAADSVSESDDDAPDGSDGWSSTDYDHGSRQRSSARLAAAASAASAAISTKAGKSDSVARGNGADGRVAEAVPMGRDAKVPTGPPAPAVTGEIPRVDADGGPTPTVVDQQPAVVDSRTIVDRPKSVSDLFSGGITGRRRLQARKVRRVIRHIDPWSVLTFSVMFNLCLYAALLLASALVFNVAEEAGTIENLESFIRELGDYETFEIDGQAIFKAAVAIAGIMTLATSVLVVLLTVMFNLLSDLLGGVRVTVIEEETVRVRPTRSDSE